LPAWTPTFEKYADVSLAAGGVYTPSAKGLYHAGRAIGVNVIAARYYSSVAAGWVYIFTSDYSTNPVYGEFIGDGANLSFINNEPSADNLVLMRMG
jgi:hypothetical protein